MSILKRRKEKEVDYFVPYFYTMGSWWINERREKYVGCRRVFREDVPSEYLEQQ